MADPASYRPAPGSVPELPGVYKFRDATGRVIYVGKAKSLRSRLNSYFADLHALHARTQAMVTTAAAVEWTVVGTEVEALQLEYSWIKEFDPRFNVRYRDDKSYPWLAVTLDEEFPRLQVMRGAKRRGVRYFGPYAHAWAIRETLDLLLRVFPARTCSAGVFKRAGQVGRPCLLGYIDKCSAPCVGRVSAEEHRQVVLHFCDFLSGKTDLMIRRLEREMAAAAQELDFERAARLRDDLGALRRAVEKQAVVLGDGADADVLAFAVDPLQAAVQVFYVRGGRVRGQRGYVVETTDVDGRELGLPVLVEQLVAEMYLEQPYGVDVPREVLVPVLPPEPEPLAELLAEVRGSRVEIRVPQRGDKRALLETVARNAEHALTQHKLRRASDLTSRSQALADLQWALGLDAAPLRIECFDVSNLQGSNVVASMVVFEDGLARSSEYRRFSLRTVGAAADPERPLANDVAAMHEVVRRRFSRYLEERVATGEVAAIDGDAPDAGRHADRTAEESRRSRRFAYPPNLVVVDGGPPQVAAAAAALSELGIERSGPDGVAVCGLAKRLEEVWLPDRADPVILPRSSECLYLLQRIRDEAHRFAITYHRQRRSRSMVESALDDVPGLGPARRRALLRHFGSLKRLRTASVAEVAAVPGMGPRTAEAVVAALQGEPAGDAGQPEPVRSAAP